MQYGDVLPRDFVLPSSAFWIREDLVTNPFRTVCIKSGAIVMDCGAYVGTFAAAALEQGAARVYCFEAHPKNADRLRANLGRYGERASVIETAISDGRDEFVTLTISGFDGAHSIATAIGRKRIIVRGVSLADRLRAFRLTVLKIDIEGAEYDALDDVTTDDLSSVESLFIEFHPIADRAMRVSRVLSLIDLADLKRASSKLRLRAFVANREHAIGQLGLLP